MIIQRINIIKELKESTISYINVLLIESLITEDEFNTIKKRIEDKYNLLLDKQ